MSGKDIIACKKTLDRYVDSYFQYLNRDDYPDRPCVRKAVSMSQDRVFMLAEYLHELKIITFEECCEYWAKVGFVDEFNEKVSKFGAVTERFNSRKLQVENEGG